MMMSREDEEQRQQTLALNVSADDFLDDDLEHLRLEEEEDDQDELDDDVSDVISRASSYGLGSSRASTSNNVEWRPKSYEHTNSLPASPYMRPSLSPPTTVPRSYSKIQVSPRLNPHLFATARSPSPVPDLNETADWPLPSPSHSVPSPISLRPSSGSPKPQSPSPVSSAANTWSAIASAGNGAFSKSPAKRPLGVSPSLLTSHLRDGHLNAAPSVLAGASEGSGITEEEMDDELRFVLELSRAEEESRQAAAKAAEFR